MTGPTADAPAPKKRSFFKRAAWMDAEKKEGDDMFSHANEFTDIVAEQTKREDEKKKKAEDEKKRKLQEQREKKRRKVTTEHDAPSLSESASRSSTRARRAGSKALSRTSLSPGPSALPSDSLTARYESLAKSAITQDALPQKSTIIVDLVDSGDELDEDDDSGYNSKSFNDNASFGNSTSFNEDRKRDVVLRPSKPAPVNDDEPEEVMDPVLAALVAKARQRAADSAQAAATPTSNDDSVKVAVAQLFIQPMMEGANPLMVKVRIDSTIEKPRLAWCGRQGFSPEVTKSVFFTWKGQRMYDSTTIRRLGIKVDAIGNAFIDGDSNIYGDEKPLPKVAVEAWTEELFKQHKKDEAADAAAKKKAAEAPPVVEERSPTPEPAPKVIKYRLTLKARGRADFKIQVNPDTDFGHLANAYKQGLKLDKSQAITLTFDGERLSPLVTVADTDIEDMDSIDVLFK
ncbi:hypothetical protein P153DRAFT_363034 [Dothidotthia symphoricarpi CBS 119687]|uniref:Rad60/SUMO-like domain-containing protein n=1 Tax=Dothidotthia symphoricarpi CBS 119687 TaxID=1392245 RepID=A0A6A6ASP7_9PLEO|nr:uncharacterized protein P153DRAFT_363034 [Dothidotthia symphoricarpi CBS 119687]KAF2134015.1 hypothetical protein P153DRAFT_363034 [Dothidotthia symphoricarpi CBS 119687]